MEFYYLKETEKPFDEVVEKVQELAKEKGFGVLAVHDIKASLAKKNIDFIPYKIIEICKPEYAAKALEADINLGLLMPCKINVYQEEGKVKVAGILASVLSSFTEADLGELPEKVTGIVKEIVDEAVKA